MATFGRFRIVRAVPSNDRFGAQSSHTLTRQNRPILRTRFESWSEQSQRTSPDYRYNLRCLNPTPAAPCDTPFIHLAGRAADHCSTARDRTQMSVKARVSRRGARDQTYGALENTGVIEGLRLNIRDLHAGGENRVRRLKHPAAPPWPDNICRGRGIREPSSLPVVLATASPTHAGHPASPGPPSFRRPTRLPKPLA